MSTFDFSGKRVLVTGASRGIGQSIATFFAESGASVIGTATSESGAQAISERLSAIEASCAGRVLNISDVAQIESFIKALQADDLMPEIVVNNAGITRDNIMMRMKADEWDAVIQTNLSGVFHLTKACLRPMIKKRWGRIINISSVVGSKGNAGQCNYAAAKAGLIGFTKSLAQEIASRHITVNAVSPGFIQTDMTSELTEQQQAGILAQIPMARLGQPSDIAAGVAFLASDLANYITGENLPINGGMWMP